MSKQPVDEAWVKRQIQEDFLDDGYEPMGVGHPVPEDYFKRFEGALPWTLLYIWRTFGFDGFADGRLWLTDPLEWEPVVEAWLEGIQLPFEEQQWHCIARTAMGSMSLWGEKSGNALEIMAVDGLIKPNAMAAEAMLDSTRRDRSGCLILTTPIEDFFRDESSGKRLVDVAIERLGPVGEDQVYALVPPFLFTGRTDINNLVIDDAASHLMFLAQTGERSLGRDLLAENRDYIEAFLAEHTKDDSGRQ